MSEGAQADAAARLERLIAAVREGYHAINNPLTAILGETQLMLMAAEGLSEEQRQGLQTIESMAYRIRDLAQQLAQAVKAAQAD